MIAILAILFALGLLMYRAFRGMNLLVLGPGMALLAALLAGGLPLLSAYTQIFMVGTETSSSPSAASIDLNIRKCYPFASTLIRRIG